MAYCSQTEVEIAAGGEAKLVELTAQDGGAAVDAEVLAAAIERADALLDEYLAKQYIVPLETVPDGIKWRSAELAVLFLREARGSLSDDQVKQREAHQAWLDSLAKGTTVAGATPQPTKSTMRVDGQKKPTLRAVNRDKLKGAW